MKHLYLPFFLLYCTLLHAQKTNLRGLVYDSLTTKKLEFVQISLEGHPEIALSNRDGRFNIAVPETERKSKLKVSITGYQPLVIQLEKINWNNPVLNVPLARKTIPSSTSIQYDANHLMQKVIQQFAENHRYADPYLVKGWYGENARLFEDKCPLFFSEGEIEIAKNQIIPFQGERPKDFVRILKAHKKALPEFYKANGFSYPVPGFIQGCFLPLRADLGSSPELPINRELLQLYFFQLEGQDTSAGRRVFIIGFKPLAGVKKAIFEGTIYIDSEKFAIVKAAYALSPSALNLANKSLEKLSFKSRQFVISYQEYRGKWHLQNAYLRQLVLDEDSQQLIEVQMNYARSGIEFRSWKQVELGEALYEYADFTRLAKVAPYDPKRGFYEIENKGRTKL